ncbi:MAG: hypothetical protein EOP88_21160 [Verrucomicrobiaceae bacterium]|nr:MAG: hypothetical protein EOP88_21160 [Verrucomicrobiaceae bacterium]
MSLSKDAKAARIARQECKVSDLEAALDHEREKLAGMKGEGPQVDQADDITPLWEVAPDMARKRSSPLKCRKAWKRIKPADRPSMEDVLLAMFAWKRDPEWKRDGGQFVPALDRWINEQRWEDPPQQTEAPSRARLPQKPLPVASDEAVTDPAEIAALLGTKPRRINS